MLRSIIRAITGRVRTQVTPAEATPREKMIVSQFVEQLSARDHEILRHWLRCRDLREVAAILGSDEETVLRSLLGTYAGLHSWLYGSGPGDGDPLAEPVLEPPVDARAA